MRDSTRIPRVLSKLADYWTRYPDMRLAQIVICAVGAVTPFAKEDDLIETWLDSQIARESVRRNCWTCKFNTPIDDGNACDAYYAVGVDGLAVALWIDVRPMVNDMPPRDSDGCPGWAAKEGT